MKHLHAWPSLSFSLSSPGLPLACLCACLLASCAGSPRYMPAGPAPSTTPSAASAPQAAQAPLPATISAGAMGLYRKPEIARKPPNADELKVVESAKLLLGQPPNAVVTVKGRKFTLDCIGTVSAIFWDMGIDVQKDFPKYGGNGVNRLYQSLLAQGALHADRYPRPGDVVFWDNTWDANGDGNRTNDLRTHAGIVLAVDEGGTVHYVHENLTKGVMIEVMNLLHPAVSSDATGKRLNNSMAIATVSGGPKPERYLSGDVFNRFGDVLRFKTYYLAALDHDGDGPRAPSPVLWGSPLETSLATR